MRIIYREYPASPSLQSLVECYWHEEFIGNSNEDSPIQRCLPTGMAKIIIHISSRPGGCVVNQEQRILPDAYLVGISKESVPWTMPGDSQVFGVKLKPEGLIQLYRRPMGDFVNDYVELETFLGKQVKPVVSQIQDASDARARIAIMENFLLQQLSKFQPEQNYFSEAIKRIYHSEGSMSIESLSKTLFVCERQLQRAFKVNLGISPKAYLRVIRFKNIYKQLQGNENLNWAELAHRYAYSDQAHFIREFKTFTGATPNVVWNEITNVSPALYY